MLRENIKTKARTVFNNKCSRCRGVLMYAWDDRGLCEECTVAVDKMDYDQKYGLCEDCLKNVSLKGDCECHDAPESEKIVQKVIENTRNTPTVFKKLTPEKCGNELCPIHGRENGTVLTHFMS